MSKIKSAIRSIFSALGRAPDLRAELVELARREVAGEATDQDAARLRELLGGPGMAIATRAQFEGLVDVVKRVEELRPRVARLEQAQRACSDAARALSKQQQETQSIMQARCDQARVLYAASARAETDAKDIANLAEELTTLEIEHADLLGVEIPNLDRHDLVSRRTGGIAIADDGAPLLRVSPSIWHREHARRYAMQEAEWRLASEERREARTWSAYSRDPVMLSRFPRPEHRPAQALLAGGVH